MSALNIKLFKNILRSYDTSKNDTQVSFTYKSLMKLDTGQDILLIPSHLHHLVNEAGNAPLGEEIAKFFDGHRGTSSHLSAHFQVRQVIPGILSFLITIILQNLNRFPKKSP